MSIIDNLPIYESPLLCAAKPLSLNIATISSTQNKEITTLTIQEGSSYAVIRRTADQLFLAFANLLSASPSSDELRKIALESVRIYNILKSFFGKFPQDAYKKGGGFTN